MPDSKHKKVWREMCHRCHTKTRCDYRFYGARGITVCKEWRDSYEIFQAWSLSNGYVEGLTIERNNNNEGYSPSNCSWATRSEQAVNRRKFSNNTSGLTGVAFNKKNGNWVAYINIDSKRKHLGSYKTANEGVVARNEYIIANNLAHPLQGLTCD